MKINIMPLKRKTKFSRVLKNTKDINKKEVSYLSMPSKLGGTINISKNRKSKAVELDFQKVKQELNNYLIRLSEKKKLQNENKSSILHTHIFKEKRKHTALPSIHDIKDLILTNKQISHKYEIIAVFDAKKQELGYTTLKINKSKLREFIQNNKNPEETVTQKINYLKTKNLIDNKKVDEKVILFDLLTNIGIEVYFSPMKEYKLDKNFNYTKK